MFGSIDVPSSFDVEDTILGFLANSGQSSLELPSWLSAEQRKKAKQIASCNPDLRCESYGFGAERQLHVFKASKPATKAPEQPPVVESTNASGSPQSGSSPASTCREMPATGDLQVRNTFIHFSAGVQDSAEERAVQTMPGGMFRDSLQAELTAKSAVQPLTSAPENPPALGGVLTPGTQVMVEGLVKAPAFNGLSGVVQSLDEETGRYNVSLTTLEGRQQPAKIKGDNLRLAVLTVMPPPPRHAPSLSLDDSCMAESAAMTGLHPLPSTPLWEEGAMPAQCIRLTVLV